MRRPRGCLACARRSRRHPRFRLPRPISRLWSRFHPPTLLKLPHLCDVLQSAVAVGYCGRRWAGRPGSLCQSGRLAIRSGRAPCPGRCQGIAACPGRRPPVGGRLPQSRGLLNRRVKVRRESRNQRSLLRPPTGPRPGCATPGRSSLSWWPNLSSETRGSEDPNLSQSHPTGVGRDDRPCWPLSYRGRHRYVSSPQAHQNRLCQRPHFGPRNRGVLHPCYTNTAALSRKWDFRCQIRIQKLVGGPGFEPGASRSRTVIALGSRRVARGR
jgi:hypothetical protein